MDSMEFHPTECKQTSKKLPFYFVLLIQVNIFVIYPNILLAQQQSSDEARIQEFCTNEEPFVASCLNNEVIVMTSAIYGRMRMGRCLEDEGGEHFQRNLDDPKFLGCSENVLRLMDIKCSGKSRCEVNLMFDTDFRKSKPCHTPLKLYLEATYQCITVIESARSCVVTASSHPLHIKQSSANEHTCGTKTQPWVIEASTGQQINVSLLTFRPVKTNPINDMLNNCDRYGIVIEKIAGLNASICGHSRERSMMVYKSYSNKIEVILDVAVNDDSSSELQRIFIGFHATGCANIVPPEDAWLRRNGNEATVGCYSSHQTWLLICTESKWTGVIGNCTQDFIASSDVVVDNDPALMNLHHVTVIVIAVLLTLIICLTVICCGAVCLQRHYSLSARQHFHLIEENYKKFNTEERRDIHDKPILVMNQ